MILYVLFSATSAPTSIPSKSPSINPTSLPTTFMPTTSDPTTVGPTAAIPTTAIPSTAIPTTAYPSTSNPSTSNPTTSNPTTALPTTIHPTQFPIDHTDLTAYPSTMPSESPFVTRSISPTFQTRSPATATPTNALTAEPTQRTESPSEAEYDHTLPPSSNPSTEPTEPQVSMQPTTTTSYTSTIVFQTTTTIEIPTNFDTTHQSMDMSIVDATDTLQDSPNENDNKKTDRLMIIIIGVVGVIFLLTIMFIAYKLSIKGKQTDHPSRFEFDKVQAPSPVTADTIPPINTQLSHDVPTQSNNNTPIPLPSTTPMSFVGENALNGALMGYRSEDELLEPKEVDVSSFNTPGSLLDKEVQDLDVDDIDGDKNFDGYVETKMYDEDDDLEILDDDEVMEVILTEKIMDDGTDLDKMALPGGITKGYSKDGNVTGKNNKNNSLILDAPPAFAKMKTNVEDEGILDNDDDIITMPPPNARYTSTPL